MDGSPFSPSAEQKLAEPLTPSRRRRQRWRRFLRTRMVLMTALQAAYVIIRITDAVAKLWQAFGNWLR